jgi:hypothetical protein
MPGSQANAPVGKFLPALSVLGNGGYTFQRPVSQALQISYTIGISKYTSALQISYTIEKKHVTPLMLYYEIAPATTFALNSDEHIIKPDHITYTPAPVTGHTLIGGLLIQGYRQMTWTYAALRWSEFQHLLSFYNPQSPRVKVTFLDEYGNWVTQSLMMRAPTYGSQQQMMIYDVSLVFLIPPTMPTSSVSHALVTLASRQVSSALSTSVAALRAASYFPSLLQGSRLSMSTSSSTTSSFAGVTFLVAASNALASTKARADYVCTGGGRDDVVIQQAINALPLDGEARRGTIELSEGDFTIGATLLVPSHVQIIGTGWGTKLTASAGLNAYMIQFVPYQSSGNTATGAEGIVIKNLFMDHQGQLQTAGGMIDGYGARQCTIEHCHLTQPYDTAIQWRGLVDGSAAQHNLVVDCLIDYGQRSMGNGRALFTTNSIKNSFVNNKILSMGGAGSISCGVFDQSGLNLYEGNNFVGNANAMIISFQSKVRVIGNIFDGGTGNQLQMDGEGHVVVGNNFYKVGLANTAGTDRALYMSSACHDSIIVGNVFSTDGGFARTFIEESSSGNSGNTWQVGNNLITNNKFEINGGGALNNPAIIRNTLPSSLIRDNQGYVTEASGTVTLSSNATNVVVNHGLSLTPSSILLQPRNWPANVTQFWTSGESPTSFVINTNSAPGGTNTITFYWEAKVL